MKSKICYNKLFILLFSIPLLYSGKIYLPSHPPPLKHQQTNVPASLIWATAYVESKFDPYAISKDLNDYGMFQLNKKFDLERGVINAFDPVESVGHAVKIIETNLMALGFRKGISAYCRGINGTIKRGIVKRYVNEVIKYCNVYSRRN